MTENKIQNEIITNLPIQTTAFRNNVGIGITGDVKTLKELAKKYKLRLIKFGLHTGSADLIGWTTINDRAIFTAIEVKTKIGRTSQMQENFLDAVNSAGGIGIVARSVEDLTEQLNKAIIRYEK